MALRDLDLACEYRSDKTNIVSSFYVPCLRESVSYWRAVGYFTTHGLVAAAKGLAEFVSRAGTMRLVASPYLEDEDIDALRRGYQARDDIVERAIIRQFEREMQDDTSAIFQHRLACIAWLVAEGRLDVKVAYPASEDLMAQARGLYHEKIGIFFDNDGDAVAFTGSPNETVGGLRMNPETSRRLIDTHVVLIEGHIALLQHYTVSAHRQA